MGEGENMGRAETRGSGRRGSSTSDKQIARAVKDYLRVSFKMFSDSPPISGWVCGADDYHWVAYTEQQMTLLVHKSCPLVTINNTPLDEMRMDEEMREKIREAVDPYRNYVMANFYGHENRSQSA